MSFEKIQDVAGNGGEISNPTAVPEEKTDAEIERGMKDSLDHDDPNLVAFASPFDHDNPKDWPIRKKWTVTSVMSATAFLRITTSTIMAPALIPIARDLHLSGIEAQMAMSVYLLASAFGPLVLGPLSEVYGRKSVLHASNVWFLVWNLACGFAKTNGLLIAARCLAGFGGSVAYALGGGVMGDIWRPEERGRSLALYFLVPLLGAAIGPICGGYITQRISWPWIFYTLSIAQGVMVSISFFLFHETYAPTILHRRAEHLRRTTANPSLYTATERLDHGRTVRQVLARSLTRPMRLLAFHPIIQIIGLLQALQYGILYLVLSTYSNLWIESYGESVATSGLHYIAYAVGEVGAAQLGGRLMDGVFRRMKRKHANGGVFPEYRAPLILPGAVLAPIGLLMYGWTAQTHAFWLAVDVSVAVLGAGLQLAGQAMQAYIIDAYPDHAGSATAASQFLRSLTAFGFPLFAPRLYASLGHGWGNSTLAFIALGVGIPVPLLIWSYGARLRAKGQSSH